MADYDFGKKYIETSSRILGLCTPASRPATQSELLPKYPASHPIASQMSHENIGPMVSNLQEGEIMKGLHVNDALLPSRRHLIQQISGLVNYSDNLIVSLAALRVLAQISQLHQYEPNSSLAGVAPNRLFSILQEEPGKLESIKLNFRHRLEREETENVQFLADGKDFPNLISTWLLLNSQGDEIERILSPDFMDAFGLTNYIRLFIVNFFAVNVSKKSFNMSHYILGFSQDSREIDEEGCLSLLIDMLTYGLGHPSVEAPVIFVEHPALGVCLLSFIKSILLAPSNISNPAREYLRTERELFFKLADSMNTRLLQVSFSAEKGYALSSELETVRSSDFHFNVFELQQKTELFQILAMDLHEAFVAGEDRLYLEKVIGALLRSSGGFANSNEYTSSLGESRIIDFLAAIDDITEDSHIKRIRSRNEGEFKNALVFEFEAACSSYIEALTLLVAEVLTILSNSDDMTEQLESLVSSLKSWLWKFMQKTTLSILAVESLVQLAVLIEDGKSFELTQEPLDAQVSVLLRPEINSTTRCFLYASLMCQSPSVISQNLSEDRFLRLVELVTRDASNTTSGAVNDSLVSVALAILEFLNRARPGLLQDSLLSDSNATGTLSYSIPSAVTSTAPFIPGLLNSLIVDDVTVCSLILSHSASSLKEEDYSILLKWRAKWSLLLNLTVRGSDSENDDMNADSNFAHRFIDGGFLESVLFKFHCLSLNVAYRLNDCGHLVLAVLHPVFKFLCTLGIATGRQTAISSRLLNIFRSTDVFDAMSVLVANKSFESDALTHSQVTHYILFLVNSVMQESMTDDFKAKLVSFRHSVLNQFTRKASSMHRIIRLSSGSFSLQVSDLLSTEVQVLQEMIDFLSRDNETEFVSSHLNFVSFEGFFDEKSSSSTTLSLGTLIFLIKTCISKLQEGKENTDLLMYLSKNLDTLSVSDLEMLFISREDRDNRPISLENTEAIAARISLIYSNVLSLQNHLVLLVEKASLLLLKHLRLKLSSISVPSDGLGANFYIDNRSAQVQAARSLKTDASIIVLPLMENYNKNLTLVDSTSNSSLYMNTLVKDFQKILSNQTNSKNITFEL